MKAESVVSPSLLGACEAIVCNAARNCQDLLFREAMLRHNDDSSEWKAAVGQVLGCLVGRHRAKKLPRGYQMPCSLVGLAPLDGKYSLVPPPSSVFGSGLDGSECNGFRLEGLERFFMVLDLTGRDRGGGVVLTKKYGKKL